MQDYAEKWRIPDSLQKFLDQGEAPVYCTFGSLQQAVPEWSMELFIETSRHLDQRMIIQTSSPAFPAGQQQGLCYFIGKHPHLSVFKDCAAVVHHGGAGTTHTATLSGCPSVVIPFMDEQLFWGRQLQKIGISGSPLPARKASSEKLAERIATLRKHPEWKQQAVKHSTNMQTHDGVAQAVRLITESFN